MTNVLKRRFPSIKRLLPVYSVIVFLVYGWTLVAFIWKLPSWLNYLTLERIFVLLAYSLFTDLLESSLFLGLLLLICAILPQRFLLDDFVIRGAVIVLCLLGSAMVYFGLYVTEGNLAAPLLLIWCLVTVIALAVFLFIAQKVKFVAAAFAWLADSLTIFVYILMPLSILSGVVILLRNIFQ